VLDWHFMLLGDAGRNERMDEECIACHSGSATITTRLETPRIKPDYRVLSYQTLFRQEDATRSLEKPEFLFLLMVTGRKPTKWMK
jgi:hypothetical protein